MTTARHSRQVDLTDRILDGLNPGGRLLHKALAGATLVSLWAGLVLAGFAATFG